MSISSLRLGSDLRVITPVWRDPSPDKYPAMIGMMFDGFVTLRAGQISEDIDGPVPVYANFHVQLMYKDKQMLRGRILVDILGKKWTQASATVSHSITSIGAHKGMIITNDAMDEIIKCAAEKIKSPDDQSSH